MRRSETAGGITIALQLEDTAQALTPRSFDISTVPRARVVLSRAWQTSEVRIDIACVQAGSTGWVGGLQGALLDGASGKVRAALDLRSLSPAAIVRDGARYRQSFVGEGSGVYARGWHLFGFVSPDRDALLCTAVCSASRATWCEAPLESVRVEARFVEPPAAGLFARAVLGLAHHPWAAFAGCVLFALVVVTLLLRFRPRSQRF